MATMHTKRTRDYYTEDALRIHNPNPFTIQKITREGQLPCDCCFNQFDTDEVTQPLFKYTYDGCSRRKIKEFYCSGCLEHFGAVACPSIRGVPAYKKVDLKVLEQLRNN